MKLLLKLSPDEYMIISMNMTSFCSYNIQISDTNNIPEDVV